jgi:hypothetical protein
MTEQARTVRRFVERRPPRRPRRTGGYVIAAGKGGIGTSTAAILLAQAALARGPVVLVDAHPGLVGLDRMLGIPEADAEGGVRSRVIRDGFSLVHLPEDPVRQAPERRAALRRAARFGEEATVIVDAGAHPGTVLDALTDFDGALVTVVGPDGVSAPAAFGLAKLAWRKRPETPLAALAARADDEQAQLLHEAIRSAALRFANHSVTWLGRLPESGALGRPEVTEWAAIAETDPVVWHAAVRAWRRLVQPDSSRNQPTLKVWE